MTAPPWDEFGPPWDKSGPPWDEARAALGPDEARLVAALSSFEAALELPDLPPLSSVEASLDPALAGQFAQLSEVLSRLVQMRASGAAPPGGAGSDSAANSAENLRRSSAAAGSASGLGSPGSESGGSFGGEVRRLGRFEILREIGRGGHGIVLLARDPQLGRRLALKVPRPELLVAPGARQRFLREGRAAAALDHPNLVAVYEAGESGPICYLAQEFCAGENLETWLARHPGPLAPRLAAEIVAGLADGVEHAHRRGVVHRDLKPGNVLIESRVAEPRSAPPSQADAAPSPNLTSPERPASSLGASAWFPRIVDFGLARIDHEPGTLTATGALLGTPAYMAPEQLEGSIGPVGPATDIYALGTILYQLLTLRPPFQGASQTELLKGILLDRPPAPRGLRPGLPADLEAICLRALEKKPLDRYATAADLAADLRRYLRGEPTMARPVSPLGRLIRWARRSPALAGSSILAAAALVALLAASLIFNQRLSHSLRTSEAERARAQASEYLARDHVYASDLSAAHQAWLANDLASVDRIVAPYRPGGELAVHRTIEAEYLDQLLLGSSQLVARRQGRLGALAVAPGGEWLAAGGQDGSLAVWRLEAQVSTPLWRQSLEEGNEINAVAFSPDGLLLAVAADQGPVQLFQAATGRAVAMLEGHQGWVADVCFSPDGQLLASAGSDHTARVWDLASRTCRATLAEHGDIVRGARFVEQGQRLATTSEDQQLRLWDVATGGLVDEHHLKFASGPDAARPTDLALAPDDQTLAVTLESSSVSFWQTSATGLAVLDVYPKNLLRTAALLSDGQTFWAGTNQGEVLVWTRGQAEPHELRRGHRAQVLDIVATPDGQRVFTGSRDGELRQWLGDDGLAVRSLVSGPWNPRCLTLSPAGDRLAVGTAEGRVIVLATRPVAIQRELLVPSGGRIDEVDFSPDGQQLLARTENPPSAVVWQVDSGQLRHDLSELVGPRGTSRFLPDGRSVWTANARELRRVDLASGRVTVRTELDETIRNGDVSADGKTLAIGGQDGGLWLLDTKTLQTMARLPSHAGSIQWLRFSPSGTWLVTTGDDLAVRIWDWRRKRLRQTLSGVEAGLAEPHFSADERTVFGIAPDLGLMFWSLPTGRLTLRVEMANSYWVGCMPDPAGAGIYVLNHTPLEQTRLLWLPLTAPLPGDNRAGP